MRKAIVGAVLVALAMGVAAQAETLRIEGSTTVGPIADAFAEYFKSVHPDLEITVNKTGSGNGATALIEGRCDIAAMSRFMSPEEFSKAVANKVYPVAWTIAMDGVCVVVHPSNPVKALTSAQVRDIYMGKITNWSQVGGSNTPIVVISRDTSSGHLRDVRDPDYEEAADGRRASSTSTPIRRPRPGSGPRRGHRLRRPGIPGRRQDRADRRRRRRRSRPWPTARYPLSRPLFLFTNGFPKLGSIPFKFVTFYLTEKGQELIEAKDFVPVTNY